jgi:uncharacterized protein YndB with AHSA1/START domain
MTVSDQEERTVYGEVTVPAGVDGVWAAWTTEEGVRSFFAPACHIRLEPDGPYEIFFNPDAPAGQRGAEGLRVLAVQPKKMFSFNWNAPAKLNEVCHQRTHVILRFYALGPKSTRVTVRHDGWGEGGQWDEAFSYFQSAWNKVVLPRLAYRFQHGPIDWQTWRDLVASR